MFTSNTISSCLAICTQLSRAEPRDRQTDRQTPHTSVTIVCISCIRCRLEHRNGQNYNQWPNNQLTLLIKILVHEAAVQLTPSDNLPTTTVRPKDIKSTHERRQQHSPSQISRPLLSRNASGLGSRPRNFRNISSASCSWQQSNCH